MYHFCSVGRYVVVDALDGFVELVCEEGGGEG